MRKNHIITFIAIALIVGVGYLYRFVEVYSRAKSEYEQQDYAKSLPLAASAAKMFPFMTGPQMLIDDSYAALLQQSTEKILNDVDNGKLHTDEPYVELEQILLQCFEQSKVNEDIKTLKNHIGETMLARAKTALDGVDIDSTVHYLTTAIHISPGKHPEKVNILFNELVVKLEEAMNEGKELLSYNVLSTLKNDLSETLQQFPLWSRVEPLIKECIVKKGIQVPLIAHLPDIFTEAGYIVVPPSSDSELPTVEINTDVKYVKKRDYTVEKGNYSSPAEKGEHSSSIEVRYDVQVMITGLVTPPQDEMRLNVSVDEIHQAPEQLTIKIVKSREGIVTSRTSSPDQKSIEQTALHEIGQIFEKRLLHELGIIEQADVENILKRKTQEIATFPVDRHLAGQDSHDAFKSSYIPPHQLDNFLPSVQTNPLASLNAKALANPFASLDAKTLETLAEKQMIQNSKNVADRLKLNAFSAPVHPTQKMPSWNAFVKPNAKANQVLATNLLKNTEANQVLATYVQIAKSSGKVELSQGEKLEQDGKILHMVEGTIKLVKDAKGHDKLVAVDATAKISLKNSGGNLAFGHQNWLIELDQNGLKSAEKVHPSKN